MGVLAVILVAVGSLLWFRPHPGLVATNSSTTPASSASPSTSPSGRARSPLADRSLPTIGPAKCASDQATTSYFAVGWRGTRVVVLARHVVRCEEHDELLSADPAVGQWRTDYQPPADDLGGALTDGNSIAMGSDSGIVVIDAADNPRVVPGTADPSGNFLFYGMQALPTGGYLVVIGPSKLYRIASDGSGMTADPLPAGYVAVAPTSDPNLFILAPSQDVQGAGSRPFRAYLWDIRSGSLKLVAPSVLSVAMSTNSLARLSLPKAGAGGGIGSGGAVGSWLSLAADGSVQPLKLPAVDGSMISPDASLYVHLPDPSSMAAQAVELRLTATEHVVASFHGAIWSVVWNGSVAAMVSGPSVYASVGPGQEQLVILDGSTIKPVPLP